MKPPHSYQKWMAEDDAQLEKLQLEEIDTRDTALGRHQETFKRQLIASIGLINKEEM